MKKYLFLGLIYTLNIILFLFAKSAGAEGVLNKPSGRSPAVLEASKLVVPKTPVFGQR